MVAIKDYRSFLSLKLAALFVLPIFMFHGSTNAQELDYKNSYNLENRFHIGFTAFSANALQLESKNDIFLNSRRSLSGELGLSYDFYQSESFFISAGLGIGVVPFNFNFDIPASGHSIDIYNLDLNYYYYLLIYTNIPVLLNYVFKQRDDIIWHISLGANYSRMFFDGYDLNVGMTVAETQTSEDYEIFRFFLNDTISRHHLNFLGGVNASWETKSNRLWTIGLIAQIGTRKIGTGSYRFTNVNEPSTGTVALGFNYIGIRTAYGLRTKGYKIMEAERRYNKKIDR